jgi:hypothetical protein
MNLDLATKVLAFLTALIFFASAILSFINARHTEAKTPEARSNVVNVVIVMLLLLSFSCTTAATAAIYFHLFFVWGALLLASSGLQIVSILLSAAPVTRIAIGMVALNIALGTSAFDAGTTFYYFSLLPESQRLQRQTVRQTLDSINELQKIVDRTINVVDTLQKNVDALLEIMKTGAAPRTPPVPAPPP